jgi:transposase
VLSVALLSDLPELGRLNRGEIAALAGVAPLNCDSGTLHGQRRIVDGRVRLRRALYMAAVSSVQSPAQAYLRLRAAGKPPKAALVAVMRKLILIPNAMLKDSQRLETAMPRVKKKRYPTHPLNHLARVGWIVRNT